MLSHTAVFNLGEVSSFDDRGKMPLPEKKSGKESVGAAFQPRWFGWRGRPSRKDQRGKDTAL